MNQKQKEQKWLSLREALRAKSPIANEIIDALRDHHALYSGKLIDWLADLYDPQVGGFYYSNSGRDTDGYLPDIESTYQAVNILTHGGVFDSVKDFPDSMKNGIKNFTLSLFSEDDGYIYHPQWGKSISDSRRGRDLNWAVNLSSSFGFDFPSPTAHQRLAGNKEKEPAAIPPHLKDKRAFLSYLESFDWKTKAYSAGNQLAAQINEISARGLLDTALDFLDSVQNPDTGVWHTDSGYAAVNAAFKISFLYIAGQRRMPNTDLLLDSAISAITTDKENPGTVCYVYNTWYNILNILKTLDTEDAVTSRMLEGAPDAIRKTTEKLSLFRIDDGSFSMCQGHTVAESQRARVALSNNIKEGDVNATVIASVSTTQNIYSAIGERANGITLFGDEERCAFLERIAK